MELNDTVIVTPYESPSHYHGDWRHTVAIALRDSSDIHVPDAFKVDPWIRRQVAYLEWRKEAQPGYFEPSWQVEHRAYSIFTNQHGFSIRDYLEPLLLTDVPLSVVAEDLNYDLPTIQHYERLYYSCRHDDDQDRPASSIVRVAFALEDEREVGDNSPIQLIWRFIAATLGYTPLMYSWQLADPSGPLDTDRAVFQSLARANLGQMSKLAVTGQMEAIDITGYLSQYMNYVRLEHDTKLATAKDEGMELALSMLKMMAPQMVDTVASGAALEAYVAGNQNVIEAETAISGTDIKDNGALGARATLAAQLSQAGDAFAKEHEETND